MKEKIKEIQDYFKEKLLKGDYKVTSIEEHTCTVLIDDECTFIIWMANGAEHRKLYNLGITQNFIHFYLTQEESILLDSLLVSDYKKFLVDELVSKKERELEKLKESLK